MTEDGGATTVTIAVIGHHLRGYREDCLESLGASNPAPGVEYLLVGGEDDADAAAAAERFPRVRRVEVGDGDRATAKNAAVAAARGEFVLLATSDTVARPGAVAALRRFIEGHGDPTIVSAQLLLENGMPRRTAYRFPSLARELNLFHWVWRWRALVRRTFGRRQVVGPRPAAALHANFLMARREVFEQVGEFAEGYRFGYEDMEWCWRAACRGIGRSIFPEACVFKLPPQLRGELSVAVRVAMERSMHRLVMATRGPWYGRMFNALRRAKSLFKWVLCGGADVFLCGRSVLMRNEAVVHKALCGMAKKGRGAPELARDIESHVRWEEAV